MKKIFFLSVVHISFSVFAVETVNIIDGFTAKHAARASNNKTSCICQIGQEPAMQLWFFKKGCEVWLNEQKDCDEKRILKTDPYKKEGYRGIDMGPQFRNGMLKLGYVGHWGAGIESYNYFKRVIIPTIERFDVSIFWDNSGCSGLNAPEVILELSYMQSDLAYKLNKIGFEHQLNILTMDLNLKKSSNADEAAVAATLKKIEDLENVRPLPPQEYPVLYKAVQVSSIGVWDRKFNQSSNLWALVDFQSRKVIYPNCQEFEDQACTGAYQNNESGNCIGSGGKLEQIICCDLSVARPSEVGQVNASSQSKWTRTCQN